MRIRTAAPAALALTLAAAGLAWAQTTPAPLAAPPEKVEGAASPKPPANTPAPTPNRAADTAAPGMPVGPVAGANSFTEAQAKSRIEDAGYAKVSALALDGKGIWRGTATKDGKSVQVALDYQGNVVAQ